MCGYYGEIIVKRRSFRDDFDDLEINITDLKPFLQKALNSASSPSGRKIAVDLTDEFKGYCVDKEEFVQWVTHYFYVKDNLFLTTGWVNLRASLSYLSKEHKRYLCSLINDVIENVTQDCDKSRFFKTVNNLLENSLQSKAR